jgi:transketolase
MDIFFVSEKRRNPGLHTIPLRTNNHFLDLKQNEPAAHHRLDNLVAVLDVNRLGQRGETMYGHNTAAYAARVGAFGWETLVIDGHAMEEIMKAGACVQQARQRPLMIIARTVKGKGVSLVEDRNGWHGGARAEQLERALELGPVDATLTGAPSPGRQLRQPSGSPRSPRIPDGRSRRAGRTATR